ncbi:unnamed protein product [Paramecium sonneborni]|uniref:Uncharacterized protein n=1 Tax=Paramecium sonneborni TaxID=65129 RepID=A0A8S1QPC6_9CILI|nr:unnamed protein product [Paramecium sonneborni]
MGITCSNNQIIIINEIENTQKPEPRFCNNNQQNTPLEFQCYAWNRKQQKLIQKKFTVHFTQENQIKYLIDGYFLRIEQIYDFTERPEVLTNFYCIKYLEWDGKYGENLKKNGKWTVNCKGKNLITLGGYYSTEGLKQGLWTEIIKNYSEQAQIYEVGEYFNNLRIGKWTFVDENKQIGCGRYNEYGQKIGKWINLDERYSKINQVLHVGEYKNGKKVGRWDIFFRKDIDQSFLQIGGGLYHYNNQESSIKVGNWIELSESYYCYSQITYNGLYKNNIKISQWDTYNSQKKIGGGSYTEQAEGSSFKVGNWIEIDECYKNKLLVIYPYHGYYQNGQKVGRWEIIDSRYERDINRGGGSYQIIEGMGSIKTGRWVELLQVDSDYQEFTCEGEYKNGYKVGRWDIFLQNNLIGGGQYLEVESIRSVKTGKWIELHDDSRSYDIITYDGEYKEGIKVGKWDIIFNRELIGGGLYDQVDGISSLKNGKWIEWKKNYSCVTYNGEYQKGIKVGLLQLLKKQNNKFSLIGCANYDSKGIKIYKQDINSNIINMGEFINRIKIGRWNTFYKQYQHNDLQLIGGGSYNQMEGIQSIKIGNWVELWDGFYSESQVILSGQYENGKKVDRWNILYRPDEDQKFQMIGGGQYKNQIKKSSSVKIGEWIELSDVFYNGAQVIYHGCYKNGNKVGKWNSLYRKDCQEAFELIGGGLYKDEKNSSFKIGNWIELSSGFYCLSQVTYVGNYINGKKVGRWEIWFRDRETKVNEQIGGGFYLDQGSSSIKTGNWIELSDEFYCLSQVTYAGDYKNGIKVGRWDIWFRHQETKKNEQIGREFYNDQVKDDSRKNGIWTQLISNFGNGTGLKQIIYNGAYKNDKKVGIWEERERNKYQMDQGFIKIKEIIYDY